MDANSRLASDRQRLSIADPMAIPLLGRSLIEASAGTGKTHVLSLLYLRLLLGIGEGPYLRPLTVDEILVVTFTNLATEELRFRIRENIRQLRIACLRGYHSEAIYSKIVAQISDVDEAADLLRLAEQKMDNAAIYTIHGFCQRVLSTNVIESGVLFEYDFSLTMDDLYEQVFQDFWRRFFNPLPITVAKQIKKEWDNPEKLAETFREALKRSNGRRSSTITAMSTQLIVSAYNEITVRINQIKASWQRYRNDIETIIQSSGVNKRSYSNKNLPNWLLAIDQWTELKTEDFTLPAALHKFRFSILEQKSEQHPPDHPLFHLIDSFYRQKMTLKTLLFESMLNELTGALSAEKEKRARMEPSDLLMVLKQALTSQHGDILAAKLAHYYPVALIDEFQDTDEVQYQIFDHIYQHREHTALILMGDPKQAIYQFRGADVSVYLKAKESVDHLFIMDTNWRSSANLVAAINQLFTYQKRPFIFEQIPFIPVKSADKNYCKRIELFGKKIPAVQYYLLPDTMTTVEHCRYESAKLATRKICHFLNAGLSQQGFLVESSKKVIVPSDIVVLVRDKSEAAVMKKALTEAGVGSVFLSNRLSVFQSIQAKEMLWLLQAILTPQNPQYIYTALATRFFAVSMSTLDDFQGNPTLLDQAIVEFNDYRHYWDKFGVLAVLRYVMKKRAVAQTMLAMQDGERMLIDFVHLGELLQKMAEQFDSKETLLRWLANKITSSELKEEEEQRLESDQDLVRIVTIHKSKGLEYPIVILPFIGFYKKQVDALFYNRSRSLQETGQDSLSIDQEIIKAANEERLAEELRLCYVALTRAVFYCLLGIATVKSSHYAFHESALGYLVQHGEAGDSFFLRNCLMKLPLFVPLHIDDLAAVQPIRRYQENRIVFSANHFNRRFGREWSISSYSSLCIDNCLETALTTTEGLFAHFDSEAFLDEVALHDEIVDRQQKELAEPNVLSIHHLPRGAKFGTLMHKLLETQDFSSSDRSSCFQEFKRLFHLTDDWDKVLTAWLTDILTTPLNQQNLVLNQISNDKKLVELAFYLPIRATLTAAKLNDICQRYHSLSVKYQPLSFKAVTGMLKGFIDLVFEWQGRFYIVDYKSNWLGDNLDAYNQPALERAIIAYHYDLQYQLYTLALHRYLKQRLVDYHYEKHMGGVYYLFLRGMSKLIPRNGVFYTKLDEQFIDELDNVF